MYSWYCLLVSVKNLGNLKIPFLAFAMYGNGHSIVFTDLLWTTLFEHRQCCLLLVPKCVWLQNFRAYLRCGFYSHILPSHIDDCKIAGKVEAVILSNSLDQSLCRRENSTILAQLWLKRSCSGEILRIILQKKSPFRATFRQTSPSHIVSSIPQKCVAALF